MTLNPHFVSKFTINYGTPSSSYKLSLNPHFSSFFQSLYFAFYFIFGATQIFTMTPLLCLFTDPIQVNGNYQEIKGLQNYTTRLYHRITSVMGPGLVRLYRSMNGPSHVYGISGST